MTNQRPMPTLALAPAKESSADTSLTSDKLLIPMSSESTPATIRVPLELKARKGGSAR